jgi:hypothetical protein
VNPTHFNFAKSEFSIGEKDRGLVGSRSPAKGVSQRGLRNEARVPSRIGDRESVRCVIHDLVKTDFPTGKFPTEREA